MGPFERQFDFSRLDVDIFKLASVDSNEIINVYRLSDLLTNFSSTSNVFRWVQDDASRFYLILLFDFDQISGSEPIKLGIDFKVKIKVNGRQFHFWLNSMSIRRTDLPRIYTSNFNIPETVSDDELMDLIIPTNVVKKQKIKK